MSLLVLLGCAPSESEVKEARRSAYDAEFARVYNAVLAEVRKRYPIALESPRKGKIETHWSQLRTTGSGQQGRRGAAAGGQNQGPGTGRLVASNTETRYFFVRFDVRVYGDGPWKVDVKGTAGQFEVGGKLAPLRKGDIPPWLPRRQQELEVAIYKRLKSHAIKRGKDDPTSVAAPTRFHLPRALRDLLKSLEKAFDEKRYLDMRKSMAERFQWDPRATPSADLAVVAWQSSKEKADAVAKAVRGNCTLSSDGRKARCESAGGIAHFERTDGAWLFMSYVSKP